jgi:cobyrinic acid a,c-diamide synthase
VRICTVQIAPVGVAQAAPARVAQSGPIGASRLSANGETPRGLVIAAPRSGAGKTTVTLALVAALRRRGVRVATAKSGPDFIDPEFHAAASLRASLNLDSWAMPPALLGRLAAAAAAGAEVLLIEAAMGLFDGVAAPGGRGGSAADLAKLLGLPVLLVLDVSGQSQSAAAVARGFALHDPAVTMCGVVLNRVGSARHRDAIAAALADAGMALRGALPREAAIALPERHLGLVQAREHAALGAVLDRLADLAETSLDLDAILADAAPLRADARTAPFPAESTAAPPHGASTARPPDDPAAPPPGAPTAPPPGCSTTVPPDDPTAPPSGSPTAPPPHGPTAAQRIGDIAVGLPPPGQRIAIADDAAFSFFYPHLRLLWQHAGASLHPFSPLAGEAPPEGCDACWLPGGYPELHAARLAAADQFWRGLQRFAETRAVHGECGGYMVLGRALQSADGAWHAMAGLLGHTTSFAQRRLHLGYRAATLLADGPLGPAGTVLRGHEFHHATQTEAGPDAPLVALRDAAGRSLGEAGGRRGRVTGSFFHVIAEEHPP